MDIEEIKRRIVEIDSVKDDPAEAHFEEKRLLHDFVRYIADSGHDTFSSMAKEVLKAEEIRFSRWYS